MMRKRDQVRVLRIIEYTGDREAVERAVESSLHGSRHIDSLGYGQLTIRAATIGEYPEILGRPYGKDECSNSG